jgi:hypothetical protein
MFFYLCKSSSLSLSEQENVLSPEAFGTEHVGAYPIISNEYPSNIQLIADSLSNSSPLQSHVALLSSKFGSRPRSPCDGPGNSWVLQFSNGWSLLVNCVKWEIMVLWMLQRIVISCDFILSFRLEQKTMPTLAWRNDAGNGNLPFWLATCHIKLCTLYSVRGMLNVVVNGDCAKIQHVSHVACNDRCNFYQFPALSWTKSQEQSVLLEAKDLQ